MATLVIVESPGKIKKISAILGGGYTVAASVGHVRDLPPKDIGLEPPGFDLRYEPTERGRDVLKRLKSAVADAAEVILATDPDREGEAIAWHLADALRLRNAKRVTFTAITREQIRSAFATPRPLDLNLVRAQEARRALDRIFGYRVSPALSDRAGQPLSAGRVQSPAVILVVDREREIAVFRVTEHYGAELTFEGGWRAVLNTAPHLGAGEQYLLDRAIAERAAAVRRLTVSAFEDTRKGRKPPAPFTTSTLQRVAGQRLKLKPKRTMELAQRLYEQGAITYHRTDNPNIDPAGIADIAAYAQCAGLQVAAPPRKWKAKEGAQEGHEAIRPAHAAVLEAGESDEEKALYRLIWQRAVASQIADAIYAVRTATLTGDADGMAVEFVARGRTLLERGWLAVYAADDDDGEDGDQDSKDRDSDDGEADNPVPRLATGSAQTAADGQVLVRKTRPPPRFTQATLPPELERLGIGRPSTYAAILDNITARGYVAEDAKGCLVPSRIGETIRDALVGRFAFAGLDYTRRLENLLDDVAEGKTDYRTVVAGAWDGLDRELATLAAAAIEAKIYPCAACGKPMRRRLGGKGYFWACSGYPDCRTTLPDGKGGPGERKAPSPPTGFNCPACGRPLARRQGISRPKKKGGKPRAYDFYSCTGFPACKLVYMRAADGTPDFGSGRAPQGNTDQ